MLNWFVESKTRYLIYILFWKVADIGSTFLIAGKYGWWAEANFTAIGQFGPQFGHTAVSLTTIPFALILCYIAYIKTPVSAEIAMLFFPFITVGNLISLFAPTVGSFWNVAAIALIPTVYLRRGLKPLWFERSPSRDELLENIRTARSWKDRLRGGQGAV